MLLTLGNASAGDYGEESLVGRLLLSLILNEYAVVNVPDGRAFCAFGARCLGLKVLPGDMARATATIEFQANRCGTGGDATTFDSLFTLERDWVWGIEAKYFDVLRCEQIEREVRASRGLASKLGYARSGVLFLVPEQQLGTIISQNGELRARLAALMRGGETTVRVTSWEIVSEILVETGTPESCRELGEYWKLRNQNENYSAKVAPRAKVRDWMEWQRYILGETAPPSDLPRLADLGQSSFSRFGQASAEVAEVFDGGFAALAEQVVQRARRFGFEPKGRQQGYVNLSRSGRAHAQIHPQPEGVALVVREAAGGLRPSAHLTLVPYQSLPGYRGRNKPWLEGDGKYTFKPAAAVLVPAALGENPQHVGWQEVDAVLRYAQSKS
jgi:hypothetical protein